MASAGNVAAGNADGSALAANCSDAVCLGSAVDFLGLDTGAQLERRPLVPLAAVVGVELEVLELVCPDGQGASTDSLVGEVMARILDVLYSLS